MLDPSSVLRERRVRPDHKVKLDLLEQREQKDRKV
jgi:hypothetical protein